MPNKRNSDREVRDVGESVGIMAEEMEAAAEILKASSSNDYLEPELQMLRTFVKLMQHNIERLAKVTGQRDPHKDDIPF